MQSRYYASFDPHIFRFKKPAGTSRGFLNEKKSWFLKIRDMEQDTEGVGECSIIPGLSIDIEDDIGYVMEGICREINQAANFEISEEMARNYPAVKFALESAILNLNGGGHHILFNNSFSRGKKGIPINGLVWMSDIKGMFTQAEEKIESGFKCLKFKIGALDFNSELELLKRLRITYGSELEIRLDANGAFKPGEALEKLDQLSAYQIHSIEQPIAAGQWKEMAMLCKNSPVPIALDEELIGIYHERLKNELIQTVNPHYIILKPSLLGGFGQADEWIKLAETTKTGWWVTSALESNIGLNAIAQWTAEKNPLMHQGLGTGSLYVNNIPLPLEIIKAQLWFHQSR